MATSDAPMIPWGRIDTRADRVLIVGAGPSLGRVDEKAIIRAADRGVHIIAVNAALLALRCANDWFSLDFDPRTREIAASRWNGIQAIAAVPDDFGPKAALAIHRCIPPEGVTYLRRITGSGPFKAKYGLSESPGAVHTGNSVWGAMGVAWHMHPRRVGFLGLDGTAEAGFPTLHRPRSLDHLPELFASAMPQIEASGAEVRNGNPESRVTCFPRAPTDELLEWMAE